MPKKDFASTPRLFLDTVEIGAIAANATTSVDFTPERDMELSELLCEAWDANGQPFARENRSSGNTAAGNAVPSLSQLSCVITEDNNNVPFQKPFRLSLITSSGDKQRVLPYPIRLYEGSRYRFSVTNNGTVAVAGLQFGLPYNRAEREN
jgi:hypothetical protein